MALVMGVSVANPFYAQSLLPSVECAFGLNAGTVLLGPMATQLGMALGFLFLIPLGKLLKTPRDQSTARIGCASPGPR
jgi:hypothetical protein